MARVFFFLNPIEKDIRRHHESRRLRAHFLATGFATPRVATFWRSLAAFQILAMRFAARVWIPGNAWVALLLFLLLLLDLVALIMVLPAGVKAGALCDCATISFWLWRPDLWRVDSEDTMSLRLVFVIVRVTDCPIYRITFVDFWSFISYQNSRMLLATTWLGRVPVVSGASATPEDSSTESLWKHLVKSQMDVYFKELKCGFKKAFDPIK